MSNQKKERRCKICDKLLIDEKLPICSRCFLNERNTAGKVGGIISGAAVSIFSAAALSNNLNDPKGHA